jgi:succinate dehydrogenase / fumarate reductase membrane anchor subunit
MKESTLWVLFILAGAVIIVLLGIHMAIMHLDDLLVPLGIGYANPLSFDSVAMRSKMILHVIIYTLLLATALFHGLYGLRSIIYETPIGSGLKRLTDVGVTAAGIAFFLWGAAAIITGYLPH